MAAPPATDERQNHRTPDLNGAFEAAAVQPGEAQAELNAVCRSRAFERSERLQDFLRFICARTLRGEGSQINEYLIGVEVFQRGGDYSPSEDSVVRRQAHALRQKLQKYYGEEGASSAVRIELPVGHYVPVFRRQPETPATTGALRPNGSGASQRWNNCSLSSITKRRTGATG